MCLRACWTGGWESTKSVGGPGLSMLSFDCAGRGMEGRGGGGGGGGGRKRMKSRGKGKDNYILSHRVSEYGHIVLAGNSLHCYTAAVALVFATTHSSVTRVQITL